MASLTFFNTIPTANQRLKDSQPQIQTNFASLQTFLETNHVAFSDGNSGKHRLVELTQFAGTPVIGGTESAIYSKDVSGSPELFIKTGTDAEINITNDVLKNANGYTRLPTGIIIKWGAKTVTRNTLSAELTFDPTVAFSSAPYIVIANQTFSAGPTTGNLNVAVSTGDYTTTGFKAFARAIGLPSGSTVNINYIAIGI